MIYLAGPGHGGPAVVANVYLEGTYSEIYPEVSQDVAGMRRLFRQFSTPGGIPSHVSVPTPGSIHEGGELGYVLVHAFGAAFDNPELIVAAVVGDGEAETGPLEGSWKGIDFLNPARDGAVLPILHLNGYKIAGPTRARPRRATTRCARCSTATATRSTSSRATTRRACTSASPRRSTPATRGSGRSRRRRAHGGRQRARPRWPAIVLRTPKGWTGPKVVDGVPVEGTFRAHQVPLDRRARRSPSTSHMLEAWMRSYRPEELFDAAGRLVPELAALAPGGRSPHGRQSARQRRRACCVPLDLPDFRDYALPVPQPATERHESTRQLGKLMRDIFTRNARRGQLPALLPGRDELQPARRRLRGGEPVLGAGPSIARRRSRRAGRAGDGGAQRAQLPGLARGLRAHRPPRPVRDLRGVRHGRRPR